MRNASANAFTCAPKSDYTSCLSGANKLCNQPNFLFVVVRLWVESSHLPPARWCFFTLLPVVLGPHRLTSSITPQQSIKKGASAVAATATVNQRQRRMSVRRLIHESASRHALPGLVRFLPFATTQEAGCKQFAATLLLPCRKKQRTCQSKRVARCPRALVSHFTTKRGTLVQLLSEFSGPLF